MFNENHFESATEPMPTISMNEKISNRANDTKNRIEYLRGTRNQFTSHLRNAQVAQDRIKQELNSEKQELTKLADENIDPSLLAFIETRKKEIEKELIEAEIEWMEKKIWDLRVEMSPEKKKMMDEVTWIKRGELLVALTDCVGALREEELLINETGAKKESEEKRLKEIEEKIKKLESEFGEIKKVEE